MNRSSSRVSDPNDSAGPSLREIAAIVRRRRGLLLLSLAAGLVLGLGVAWSRAPAYEGSTLILVGARGAEPAALNAFTAPSAGQVGAEMELLRSRALAKAVVDSLALQLQVVEPRAAVRSEILSRLRVSPEAAAGEYRLRREEGGRFRVEEAGTERVLGTFAPGEPITLPGARVVLAPEARRHSEIEIRIRSRASAVKSLADALEIEQAGREVNVVRVRYRGPDPELVRDVPNVLTARYVALRESMQKSQARAAAASLREQLHAVTNQLTDSEERLRTFRQRERVVDPQVQATTQVTRLAQLQAERATLEMERAALADLLSEVRASAARDGTASPSPYRRMIAFPTLLRNEATSELLRSLASVEDERATLVARRTPEDPDVRMMDARIRELETQLQTIATTYLSGLTDQVRAMDTAIGRFRSELDEVPSREVEFARLSRQPRVLGAMHEQLQTRLKEAEIAQAIEGGSVQVVDVADLPHEPVGPPAGAFAGVSALFGLLMGLGLVFAREYADTTVHTRADVQAAIGIPVLGLVPKVGGAAVSRQGERRLPWARLLLPARGTAADAPALIARDGSAAHRLSDVYSQLHANIMFARPDAEMRTLLFTSPLPGDGKTTTAVNFATALAECGQRVLLIDADLRRGTVHELFGAPRGPGLSNLLSDDPVTEGVLRRAEVGDGQYLRYITAGDPTRHPVHLLNSPVFREFLESVAGEYDRIILDCPPANLFPDAAVLGASADGVVVVARVGVTPVEALVDTAEQLERATSNVVGAVLNAVDLEREAGYDRAYRWYALSESYAAAGQGKGA